MSLEFHTVKALDGAAPANSASVVLGLYTNVATPAAAAAGDTVVVTVPLSGDLPPVYNAQVSCSQPALISVAKAATGVTVTLTPLASTVTLAAGTIDVLVTA